MRLFIEAVAAGLDNDPGLRLKEAVSPLFLQKRTVSCYGPSYNKNSLNCVDILFSSNNKVVRRPVNRCSVSKAKNDTLCSHLCLENKKKLKLRQLSERGLHFHNRIRNLPPNKPPTLPHSSSLCLSVLPVCSTAISLSRLPHAAQRASYRRGPAVSIW